MTHITLLGGPLDGLDLDIPFNLGEQSGVILAYGSDTRIADDLVRYRAPEDGGLLVTVYGESIVELLFDGFCEKPSGPMEGTIWLRDPQ